jgi:tetratricopeptide (TPR) repeat protein
MNILVSIAPTQAEAMDDIRKGIAFDPNVAILWRSLAGQENLRGHAAAQHAANQRVIQLMRRPDHGGYNDQNYGANLHAASAAVAADIGDHQTALRESQLALDATPPRPGLYGQNRIQALAALHRIAEGRAVLAPLGDDAALSGRRIYDSNGGFANLGTPNANLALANEDWAEAYRQLSGLEALIEGLRPDFPRKDRITGFVPTFIWPRTAEALAHLGRLDEARALVGKTPTDGYLCVRARAKIAALGGQAAESDRWFGEAERQAPGLVIAPTEWGEAMLRRGDTDHAIAKLKEAHRLGPKFADPLEFWGEALLAKGDAKGAVAKFEDAAKFAPKWGRLHLKWAQALSKLGKTDEARTQLKTAAGLDLTPAERDELSKVRL